MLFNMTCMTVSFFLATQINVNSGVVISCPFVIFHTQV